MIKTTRMDNQKFTLKNEYLEISINSLGAELYSIKSVDTGREYLWNADSSFWNRHSPILFPIVGKVWNGEYIVEDKIYQLSQHGFARDSEFSLKSRTNNQVIFSLKYDDTTLSKYPYLFELLISYTLTNKKITVDWEVINLDKKEIYFQIGAHPAFMYYDPQNEVKSYLKFEDKKQVISQSLNSDGYLTPGLEYSIPLKNGLYKITDSTFHGKTWILENQVNSVSLLTIDKQAYIRLSFDAPVLGIWAPDKDQSPFICLEPWYGRCDSENYNGDYINKDFINRVNNGESFYASYDIEILLG